MNSIQTDIFDIFEEFDNVCKVLKIDYSICYGTHLGAVRHQGFIPWDDDIDVAMSRQDYELFLREAQKHLREGFFLQTHETDPYYYFPFAKIRGNQREMREKSTAHLPINHGVWIDIFPYDKAPEDIEERSAFFAQMSRYTKLINFFNLMYVTGFEKKPAIYFKKVVVYLNRKFYKFNFLSKHWYSRREKLIQKYNKSDSEFYYLNAFMHKSKKSYEDSRLSITEFNERRIYNFETLQVPGFKDYDTILTRMYGDYMTPPDKSERKSVHTFID